MREISFVKKLRFNFTGSVAKRALVIGDADNDEHNELLCASLQGDLAIFKECQSEKFAYAENLGMVTACGIGDVINSGRNHVMAIDMEGWLFILEVPSNISTPTRNTSSSLPGSKRGSQEPENPIELHKLYCQRMPANCKELLLVDLDGDGQNELIIGLTDRVLRTYKWIKIDSDRGKFVGLYKWEFADQIGSVSLTPSSHPGCQDIIVAQPGGTYAKLECYDKKTLAVNPSVDSGKSGEDFLNSNITANTSPKDEDDVKTEYINKLTPEYHQLALSKMRNPHISTEALGGIRNGKDTTQGSCLIALATLDGTLMLVDKDETLWNLQVDHQLFALSILESPNDRKKFPQSESSCTIVANIDCDKIITKQTTNGQYFVACAWNGKTYIIDEERNYLRFKFEEAISAFIAGNYYFGGQDHACLVYATFNNEIVMYYDVVSDPISPSYLLNEIVNNSEHEDLLFKLETLSNQLNQETVAPSPKSYDLLYDIMYNLSDDHLRSLTNSTK